MQKPTYHKFFFLVLIITLTLTGYSQIGYAAEWIDLNGVWRAGNYTAIISGSGKSYYYEGRNGNNPKIHYKHEAFLNWTGPQKYDGKAKDVDGWCCGNEGYIWIEVIDENTIKSRSEWTKPGQDRVILKGEVTLTRDKTITSPRKVVGNCDALNGEVYITRLGKTFRAQKGTEIQYGDWIETKKRSRVFIMLFSEERARAIDDSVAHITLSPTSQFNVKIFYNRCEELQREGASFSLIKGILRVFYAKLRGAEPRMRIETKNSIHGIRGTDFICEVTPDQKRDLLYVREGSVEVTGNVSGKAIVNAGQKVEVINGIVQRVKSMNNSAWNRMSADFLIPEPDRGSGSTCQLKISGALDNYYKSNSNYYLSIAVNGQTLFNDTAKRVFEHGRPYGKRFNNWKTLALNLPSDIKKGQKLSVKFKHSGSKKNEWIAVDSMELVCGSEKKRYEIGGFANYGARDGAAGIIYGRGSNGWTIQR